MNHKLKITKLGVVLEATANEFESAAVLNPACFQDGEDIHLFYRAVDGESKSSIGYAKLRGPTAVAERWDRPIIAREYDHESHGVEDPRLVKIGDTFYLTYVAHDGKNARTCLAAGRDLFHLEKKGVISAEVPYREAADIFGEAHVKDAYYLFSSYYERNAGEDVLVWHKDLILFPEKIGGRFAMLHRVLPDIQIVFFDSFQDLTPDFWRNEFRNLAPSVVLENKHWFETRNIGGGAPPVRTEKGWLVIFHAVEETNQRRVYHAAAALLDLYDPKKVIGKLHQPLFSPKEEWEKSGLVSNVVFPSATAVFDGKLHIYYGAADARIAVAAVDLAALLTELKHPGKYYRHEAH